METRREIKPTQFYVPNTKTEIAISSTLKEMIESSKFRSDSAIRKKPLKFKNVRQIFTDLGDLKQHTLKIGSSLKFDCSKDPDVVRAADLLMELSSSASSASSSSSAPPIWSDEMYSWPDPVVPVVRLKLQGMPVLVS